MNPMFLGLLRHVLTMGGGYVAAQGGLSPVEVETAVGAIMALAGIGWSLWKNKAAR